MRFLGVVLVLVGMLILYLGCRDGRENVPIIAVGAIMSFVGTLVATSREKLWRRKPLQLP